MVALKRSHHSYYLLQPDLIVDCMTWAMMKKGKEFCQCNLLRNELNWDIRLHDIGKKMKKGKEFCPCNILRNELNWDGSKGCCCNFRLLSEKRMCKLREARSCKPSSDGCHFS